MTLSISKEIVDEIEVGEGDNLYDTKMESLWGILKAIGHELTEKLLHYTYSPFRRFNITETRGLIDYVGSKEIDDDFFKILDRLQTREISKTVALALVGQYCEPAQEIFHRVINKTLIEGVGIGRVNDFCNSVGIPLIPNFLVQLAESYDEKELLDYNGVELDYYVSPKIDGMRVICVVENREVKFYSRNGLEINSLDFMAPEILALCDEKNFVLDGEGTYGDFNGTMSALRKKTGQAVGAIYHIFDKIPYEEFMTGLKSVKSRPLSSRLDDLNQLNWEAVPSLRLVPHIKNGDCHALFKEYISKGLEGVIVKIARSGYFFGRSSSWMKIKEYNEIDLKICDFVEGKGKYKGMLGKLLVDYNGVTVGVGTGISDQMRKEIWDNRDNYLGKTVEVAYHQVTKAKSLRHTRLIRFRPDKD